MPDSRTPLQRSPGRHSPCIGICRIDEETQLCSGCARSGSEIATWSSLDDAGKDAIWAELPARLPRLSVRFRLLPWTHTEIADFVLSTLRGRAGTWTVGMPGAAAEFPCGDSRDIAVTSSNDTIVGRAYDARFRLRLHEKLRAFEFTNGGPIVLGLPKARAMLSSSATFAALGPDADAVDSRFSAHELFDLGFGRHWARFCVRTDAALAAQLHAHHGRSWREVLAVHGSERLALDAHRVVESSLVRIEVFGRVSATFEEAPTGPRTRLVPALLESGHEVAPGFALPEYAATVAAFQPKPP